MLDLHSRFLKSKEGSVQLLSKEDPVTADFLALRFTKKSRKIPLQYQRAVVSKIRMTSFIMKAQELLVCKDQKPTQALLRKVRFTLRMLKISALSCTSNGLHGY